MEMENQFLFVFLLRSFEALEKEDLEEAAEQKHPEWTWICPPCVVRRITRAGRAAHVDDEANYISKTLFAKKTDNERQEQQDKNSAKNRIAIRAFAFSCCPFCSMACPLSFLLQGGGDKFTSRIVFELALQSEGENANDKQSRRAGRG